MKMQILFLSMSILFAYSCASTGKKRSGGDKKRSSSSFDEQEADDEFYVSSNFKTVTYSFSNNRLTPYSVDRREMTAAISKLESSIRGSKYPRKELLALMAAKRFAGRGLESVIASAKKLVALEMKKNPKRGLPEFAKLEIALTAIQAGKFSLAENYLGDLRGSKNKRIKAAAYTAQGIIYSRDDLLPEAIQSWNKALSVVSSYKPALLNLGFYAAKFGDFASAKKALGGLRGGWYPAYGLITAERLTKGTGDAISMCNKVMSQKPKFKPAIFNCALNELQGRKSPDKALVLVNKLGRIPGLAKIDGAATGLRREIEKKRKATRSKSAKPKKK